MEAQSLSPGRCFYCCQMVTLLPNWFIPSRSTWIVDHWNVAQVRRSPAGTQRRECLQPAPAGWRGYTYVTDYTQYKYCLFYTHVYYRIAKYPIQQCSKHAAQYHLIIEKTIVCHNSNNQSVYCLEPFLLELIDAGEGTWEDVQEEAGLAAQSGVPWSDRREREDYRSTFYASYQILCIIYHVLLIIRVKYDSFPGPVLRFLCIIIALLITPDYRGKEMMFYPYFSSRLWLCTALWSSRGRARSRYRGGHYRIFKNTIIIIS